MSELLEIYRQHHRVGRAQAVIGPPPKSGWKIAGMPWWVAGLLIVAGIVIGNLVVPYDDRKPRIIESEPVTPKPEPAICAADDKVRGPLYDLYPICPNGR